MVRHRHAIALVVAFAGVVVMGAGSQPGKEPIETSTEKLRRTLAGLRSLVTAVESYRVDMNVYPAPKCDDQDKTGLGLCSVYDIGASLKPYAGGTSASDAWGHPYWYWCSADAKHAALISTGADGAIDDRETLRGLLESCSQAPGFIKPEFVNCFESDLLWCDGQAMLTPADDVKTCR
jgi:hypothetical protein